MHKARTMDIGQAVELFIKYGLLPLVTALCTLAWHMHKKHETRLDVLEKRTTDVEKAIIEIKSDFKYTAKSLDDIKAMLQKLIGQ